MPSPNYAGEGWVARTLAKTRAIIDGNLSDVTGPRFGRYQEQYMLAPMVGEPLLCDEGALLMSGMLPGATSLQLGLSAAYSSTVAALVFKNNAPAGPSSPRCHLRDIHFTIGTAPTTTPTSFWYATVIDNVNRTPTTISGIGSPGTPATVTAYQAPAICTNIDENPTINGVWWFPLSATAGTGAPPTIPAQGPNARILVGNGVLRQQIPILNDDYRIVFGATDPPAPITNFATVAKITEPHPAVTIGPQEFFILYLWLLPSNTGVGIAFSGLDCSWFER